MLAKQEIRQYSGNNRVWVGKYKNLNNLPHWHSDCELIYADKGNATVHVNGEAYRLNEDCGMFISSKDTHYIVADEEGILSIFLFDHKLVKSIIKDRRLACPVLQKNYGLKALFERLDDELSTDFPLRALSVNNRIERLVIDVFSLEHTVNSINDDDYIEARYKLLIKDIDENYENYTLSMAASFSGLSESYFSKFFKKMSNMTFSQYLNLVKVEKAIEMLKRDDDTITKIAIACGFGTIRNFNRVFKQITGFNPKTLPSTYNTLGMHPTYSVDDTFNPTNAQAELL